MNGRGEFERDMVAEVHCRIMEPRRFIQVLIGPRQTGKTTVLKQALRSSTLPVHYASTETVLSQGQGWLRAQWELGRALIDDAHPAAVLVLDEVQSITQWSSVVKTLWEEDSWADTDLRVVLSGSSSIMSQKGLAESLMGHFELIRCSHWSFGECREAFGYTLDDFLVFGGYPGVAHLRKNYGRWFTYMRDGIIEPTLMRDVIALQSVNKPGLMRSLFYLGLAYSGQEVSYRKLMGQLDDAGNATTIAHYLELLGHAGLLCGIQKFTDKVLKTRSSSPRLLAFDTALITAGNPQESMRTLNESDRRGHLVESAVGACLLARAPTEHFEVQWWRDGENEVDFVLRKGSSVTALEVKSGRVKSRKGLTAFILQNPGCKVLVIGSLEAPLDRFLLGEIELF
jgi:predicted AAA+ superfamily ATPase